MVIPNKDIYGYMNKRLFADGYNEMDLEGKKRAINKHLKEFLIERINMTMGSNEKIARELANWDAGDLLKVLDSLTAEEDKEKVVEPVIHCFIMLLGGLQSREIVWESYPAYSEKFPTIVIDENGVIDKFVTKADTNIGEFFGPIFDDFFASIKTKNGNKELK